MTSFAERQKQRQNQYTPEKILQVAQRNGYFMVSLRYRDDWLRRRCARLQSQGLLRKERGIQRGHIVFVPKTLEGHSHADQ